MIQVSDYAKMVEEILTMKKYDWIRKLTSRSLWQSISGFAFVLVIVCGGSENTASRVTSLIMAGAAVIGCVLGEGLTDIDQK